MKRLESHWALLRDLWKPAKALIEHAEKVGATWAVEWPSRNRYWREPLEPKFFAARAFYDALMDGCMHGLVATRTGAVGRPMKKRWRIRSNSTIFAEFLHRTCDGSHTHVPVEGRDTKPTENYTEDFVRRVLEAWTNV